MIGADRNGIGAGLCADAHPADSDHQGYENQHYAPQPVSKGGAHLLGARAGRPHVRKMRTVPMINRFAPGYSESEAGLEVGVSGVIRYTVSCSAPTKVLILVGWRQTRRVRCHRDCTNYRRISGINCRHRLAMKE